MKRLLAAMIAVLMIFSIICAWSEGQTDTSDTAPDAEAAVMEGISAEPGSSALPTELRSPADMALPSEISAEEEPAVLSVRPNAVYECYSMDGTYTDDIGNMYFYSYHIPQLNADSEDAAAINAELREQFASKVEHHLVIMSHGTSLTLYNVAWNAYWNGSQIFLLVSAVEPNDIIDYFAAVYDFEKNCRVTKEMLLEQLGISEEDYLLNLREKVGIAFENQFIFLRKTNVYYDLLHRTISDENLENAMLYLDGDGSLIAIVKIYTGAGAGWYYGLITPYAYG